MAEPRRVLPSAPPGIRALTFLLLVFAVILGVMGTVLVWIVDRSTTLELAAGVEREADQQAQTFALTVAKYLWNFDRAAVRDLAEGVLATGLWADLEIRNEYGDTVWEDHRGRAGPSQKALEIRYDGEGAGQLRYSVSADEVDRRRNKVELPLLAGSAAFLLVSLLAAMLVIERTVFYRLRILGRSLEKVEFGALDAEAVGTPSLIKEIAVVQGALASLADENRRHLRTLEDRIAERTRDLRSAQDKLAHAEALRTLVALARGLSHELNSPVAAILSCAHSLEAPLAAALARTSGPTSVWAKTAAAGFPAQELWSAARRSADPQVGRHRSELRELWRSAGRDTDSVLFDLCSSDLLLPFGRALTGAGLSVAEEDEAAEALLSAQLVGVVTESAERCASVVRSLRGQLEGNGPAEPQWVTFRTLVSSALEASPASASVRVAVRGLAGLDLPVWGVAESLELVIHSLYGNATAAAQPEGWVAFEAQAGPDFFEWSVADSGPPVADELVGRLFDPYFSTKPGGLGMGLYLCRTYLTSIGGTVRYETDGGKRFTVRLPQPARG